ncbi:hypothetical protein ACFL14_00635 [Patescibacteria group bacterium]
MPSDSKRFNLGKMPELGTLVLTLVSRSASANPSLTAFVVEIPGTEGTLLLNCAITSLTRKDSTFQNWQFSGVVMSSDDVGAVNKQLIGECSYGETPTGWVQFVPE